jgi:hypothetical protein
MYLSCICIYPVKSLRGCIVNSATIDELGLVGDRRFLVVDTDGRFLTQRTLPRMALILTALDDSSLTLSAAGHGSIYVRRHPDPSAPLRPVTIWKSEGLLAEDCGDSVAEWLSAFLATTCRLVRIGPAFSRPMVKSASRTGDRVAFADAAPFLLVGSSSLADLNDRLAVEPDRRLSFERFRPNFVIADSPNYSEDLWKRVRIGDISFRSAGPCVRCIVPNIDQRTGIVSHEPLRTLATYRRFPADSNDVILGLNLIHETKTGKLTRGDFVYPVL